MTFSYLSPVFFDELDLNGALRNSRFAVHVELTAGELGRTSATYRFRCVEADNDRMLAHGHRVIVKIDEAGRPAPWSDWYRETFRRLCDD